MGIPALLDGVGLEDLVQPQSVTTRFAPPDVGLLPDDSAPRLQLDIPEPEPTPVSKDEGEVTPAPKERKRPILNLLTNDGNSATGSNTGRTGTGTGTGRPTPVKDAEKQLKEAADGVRGGLRDVAGNVKKASASTTTRTPTAGAQKQQLPNRCGTAPVDSLCEQSSEHMGLLDS